MHRSSSTLFRIILGIFSVVIFLTSNTYAALRFPKNYTGESREDEFSENSILFYMPGDLICDYPTGSFDGSVSAGLSPLQATFVDKYHSIAEKLSIEYGIPWEAVMAQGILESASGTSNFARARNNFFGIGAFDSNPGNARSYSSPAEGWRGYYENIRKTKTYRAHGAFNYPGDPRGYIRAIKAAGYATDPKYVSKVTSVIASVENRAREKGWASSAELVASHPGMTQAAENNQAGISSPYSTADNAATLADMIYCKNLPEDIVNAIISSGNMDINATALALSWDTRTHGLTANPAYQAALEALGFTKWGDTNVSRGSSCDVFVATVMRYSGTDPNMPCCGANNLGNYMASHPELYQEIPNTGSSSDLRPGDIRWRNHHVEIYVQLENGEGRIASASNGDRTADHSRGFYANNSYRIFRKKGN